MQAQSRPATVQDAENIVRVHFASVHQLASSFYSSDILDLWSGLPSEDRYQRVRQAMAGGGEIFVVAELDATVAGFGSILPVMNELRAVYVHPAAARRGVGTRILIHLEHLARQHGVKYLQMDSSINAEMFYSRNGYTIVGRGFHRLGPGVEMACVKMRKELAHRLDDAH
jgi:GNAT superfamily N-acetyltransferase